MGVAEMLRRNGSRVRLCCQGFVAGQNLPSGVRDAWIGTLECLGVEIKPYVRLFRADGESVYFRHTTNGEAYVCEDVDTLVIAQGHRREARLFDELEDWEGERFLIGDALNPRSAEEAVLEGLQVAMKI